ncbi:unnamed protein product, partial [Heterosigma akashiwo]
ELNSITDKNTYTLVDRPPNANVIGTRWVLSKKFDADGHLVKHKARLVAQGYTQEFGVDYRQTYSPVVNAASLRLLLAISANKGYAVDSLDISTAFLNGAMTEDVYVRQPSGYVDPEHPDKVWKLNKALYGLRQSPRVWYMELHDHLLSLGFQRSGHESCLYVRREGGSELMVAVYVDDLVVSGSSPTLVSNFKQSLASKYDLTDQGELTQILGIKVVQDKRNKCFYLSQTSFMKDMLTKFGLDYLPACATPMDHTVDLTPTPVSRRTLWRKYVQVYGSRRAFRYLKGTQSESVIRLGGDLVLRAFSDSVSALIVLMANRFTGYVLFLGDAPIVWSSKLQGAVTTSTVEAEYLALRSSVKDIMWLRHLLADLGCPQQEPTPVVEDNSACIEWANGLVISRKNRHFHVSYHLAKEQVSLGTIRMFFIKTHDQVADIFTKALNAENF